MVAVECHLKHKPDPAGTKPSSVAATVNLGSSYSVDVKPLVTGDGTVGLLIKSLSSDGARYYSKEGGSASQAPQLQITYG